MDFPVSGVATEDDEVGLRDRIDTFDRKYYEFVVLPELSSLQINTMEKKLGSDIGLKLSKSFSHEKQSATTATCFECHKKDS